MNMPEVPDEQPMHQTGAASPGLGRLRDLIGRGAPAFGGWCSIASSFTAELVASCGFAYVTVDMQHGLSSFGDLVPMLQGIGRWGTTPLVRVPVGDTATAQRALDAGAEGIIFPFISSKADAIAAVAACRYPPAGLRSFGPVRSRLVSGADTDRANSSVLCIVMIETQEALENLPAILATPGVDAVYVGPADLGLSLGRGSPRDGIYGQGRTLSNSGPSDGEDLQPVLDRILNDCSASAKPAGIHAPSGLAAAQFLKSGFAFASVSTDAALLATVLQSELAHAHDAVREKETPTP